MKREPDIDTSVTKRVAHCQEGLFIFPIFNFVTIFIFIYYLLYIGIIVL